MKKVIIFLIFIGVVLGAVLIFALLNLNSLIARVKPQLEEAASGALGTPVIIGKVEASVFPAARIAVREISLGGSHGLTLGGADLRVALMALLKKEIKITELSLHEPSISFVAETTGISIEGLPKKNSPIKNASKPSKEESSEKVNPTDTSPKSSLPFAIALDSFTLSNGTINFKDPAHNRTVELNDLQVASGVNLSGDEIAISDASVSTKVNVNKEMSFPLKVKIPSSKFNSAKKEMSIEHLLLSALDTALELGATAALNEKQFSGFVRSDGIDLTKMKPLLSFGGIKDTSFSGIIVPNIKVSNSEGLVPDVEGSVKLSKVSLIPFAPISDLQGAIEFNAQNNKITTLIKDFETVAAGYKLTAVNGPITIDSFNPLGFSIDELKATLNGAPLVLSVHGKNSPQLLDINSMKLDGFYGNITGNVQLTPQTKNFKNSITVKGISLPPLMKVAMPNGGITITGSIVDAQFSGSGNLGPNLVDSLNENGKFLLRDIVLPGVNIVKEVFAKLDSIPLLQGIILQKFPPAFLPLLQGESTSFKSIDGVVNVSDGVTDIKSIVLQSEHFSISGRGTFELESKRLDLQSTISFSRQLSESLVERTKQLKALVGPDGTMQIPLVLNGTVPKIIVLPDIKKVLEFGAKQAIQDKAQGAVDDLLRGKKPKDILKGLF